MIQLKLAPLQVLAILSGLAGARAASAECAAADVRFTDSSNRIYVENGAVCTLTELDLLLPEADLELVDEDKRIWFLGANIVVEDGSTLLLYGAKAGGDVDQLRMKSNNSSSKNSIVEIRAYWGNIDIRSTAITSWDESEEGPDTRHSSHGRAFIRALSYLDEDGVTPRESRMDIDDSDIGYLGYKAAESYGLSWKVRGDTDGLYDMVNVYGDVTNSTIHHNYFGAYTYGAYGMQLINNAISDNIQYGLDPHDDSDSLLVEGNTISGNGNHGFICSQRCDNLVIRNNVSSYNAGNGFMLHRNVTNSLMEYNTAEYNATDAGIAVFDSHSNVIQYNTLNYNLKGIRVCVGSVDNVVLGNTMVGNTRHGIDLYLGDDPPTINDGRPSRNTFEDNEIRESGEYAIRLEEADENVFTGNTITGSAGGVLAEEGEPRDNAFIDNVFEDNGEVAFKLAYNEGTVIEGNQIANHDLGIHLLRSEASTIAGNVITDSSGEAIYLSTSSNNTIEANTISGASVGLAMEKDSEANLVTDNTIEDVTGYAVYIDDCDDAVFEGNTLDDSPTSYYYSLDSSDNFMLSPDYVRLQMEDASSSMIIEDPDAHVYRTDSGAPTVATPGGTEVAFTGAISRGIEEFEMVALTVFTTSGSLSLHVTSWDEAGLVERAWETYDVTAPQATFTVGDLVPDHIYELYVDGVLSRKLTADANGQVSFSESDLEGHTFMVAEPL